MPVGRRNRVRPFVPEPESRSDSYPKKSMFFVKYILFFMNVLFWFSSCVLLAIGIYAIINKQNLYGKISNLTTDPAVLLVVAGGVMFFITCGGCLGALRENICLLKFYAAMLGLMLLIDRKSTRLNSSHANISYAVFCLKKKKKKTTNKQKKKKK